MNQRFYKRFQTFNFHNFQSFVQSSNYYKTFSLKLTSHIACINNKIQPPRFCLLNSAAFFNSSPVAIMKPQILFNVEDKIPLSKLPVLEKLKIDVVHSSSIPSADLLIATVKSAEATDSAPESGEAPAAGSVPVNSALDQLVGGEFSRLIVERDFKAKAASTISVRLNSGNSFNFIGILGVGNFDVNDQSTILDGFKKKRNFDSSEAKFITSLAASKCGKPLSNLISGLKVKSAILHIQVSEKRIKIVFYENIN